ncbi:sensor histidine kinase [Nocardioides sp. MAHUQ-72]|uniref:sensor histidine kinase n=1 Tax=unclassified Nocardioides TaxID=2615069 RepID=UPI003615B6DC
MTTGGSTPDRAARRPPRLGVRGRRWFDAGLVLVLLAPVPVLGVAGADPTGVALTAGQLLPLLWRRRHAVPVFVVVAALSALQAVLVDTPLWGQVAFPVAVYSVARFSRPRFGVAALLVGLCGAAVAAPDWIGGYGVTLSGSAVASYFLTIATIVVTAWALGTLGRTRSAYVDALVERGQRIELEAAQQVELAASAERARIAREMHDVVAHGLSVIVVQADGARYAAPHDPVAATAALANISTTGREALTEMRRMLGLLRSDTRPDLAPQPGLADLGALVDEARSAGAVVAARLPDRAPSVPDGVALTAYRVVQEALTNVRKHAGPVVAVRLEVTVGDEVEVVVEDDGRGAAAPGDGRGLGLVGMRERVAAHGGEVEAGPRSGGGFRVCARLPL